MLWTIGLVLILSMMTATTTDGYVIIEPYPGSPSDAPNVLLIICNDVSTAFTSYQSLFESVQRSVYNDINNGLDLWGVLINVTTSTTTSSLRLDIQSAVDAVRNLGYEGGNDSIHLAAHSVSTSRMTSTIARDDPNSYGSVILLSAYLPSTVSSLENYPLPALTVSGELDGITRITRIAREYLAFDAVSKETSPSFAAANVPVIALDGANHIQFCCDAPLSYNDIAAEVSLQETQQLLSFTLGCWVTIQSGTSPFDINFCTEMLLQMTLDSATKHFNPYNSLYARDFGERAVTYQYVIPNLASSDLDDMAVTSTYYPTADECLESKTTFQNTTGTILSVQTCICSQWFLNTDDSDVVPVSPLESPVKGLSQDMVVVSHPNDPVPVGPSRFNKDLNQESLATALAAVSPTARARYQDTSRAKQVVFIDDVEVPSGPDWFYSFLTFEPSASNPAVYECGTVYLEVASNFPSATIRGSRYGKLLPLSRAAEWIMIDSLRPIGYVDQWEPLIPEDKK